MNDRKSRPVGGDLRSFFYCWGDKRTPVRTAVDNPRAIRRYGFTMVTPSGTRSAFAETSNYKLVTSNL